MLRWIVGWREGSGSGSPSPATTTSTRTAASPSGRTWATRRLGRGAPGSRMTWGHGTSWSSTATVGSSGIAAAASRSRCAGSARTWRRAAPDARSRSCISPASAVDSTAIPRRSAPSGTSCTRRAPSWSWSVTTTTTSASPLRHRTARQTAPAAWWRCVGTGGTDLEGFREARPNSLVRIRRRARGPRGHAWHGFVVIPFRRWQRRGTRCWRREVPLIGAGCGMAPARAIERDRRDSRRRCYARAAKPYPRGR